MLVLRRTVVLWLLSMLMLTLVFPLFRFPPLLRFPLLLLRLPLLLMPELLPPRSLVPAPPAPTFPERSPRWLPPLIVARSLVVGRLCPPPPPPELGRDALRPAEADRPP